MAKLITVNLGGVDLQIGPLNLAEARKHEQIIQQFDDSQPRTWAQQLIAVQPLVVDVITRCNPAKSASIEWTAFLEGNMTVKDLGPVMAAILYGVEFTRVPAGETAPAAA